MIPRWHQYCGVWAMHEPTFRATVGAIRGVDIAAHVARMDAMNADPDAMPERGPGYAVNAAGIARIDVVGTITKYGSSLIDGPAVVDLRKALRDAVKDEDVRGILLVIDSPGGSVYGLDDLAQDIANAKNAKPVWAYIEDLGASAGYYLASQAERVAASQSAAVGAIGTYAVVEDTSKAYEEAGIQVLVFSSAGELKGMGTDGTKITDAQKAEFMREVAAFGSLFVQAVAAGRGMSEAAVKELATGRVWMGHEATTLGLLDSVESLDATYAEFARKLSQETSAMAADKIEPTSGLPAQATLKELKAAFPAANAEFREKCLENEWTLAQAKDAWIGELKAQAEKGKADMAALTAERDALRAERDALKAASVTTAVSATVPFAPGNSGSAAQTPDGWKAEYAASADLQREFGSEVAYVAFQKNAAAGNIRFHKATA